MILDISFFSLPPIFFELMLLENLLDCCDKLLLIKTCYIIENLYITLNEVFCV